MASGKVHARDSVNSAPVGAVAAAALVGSIGAGVALAAGSVAGVLFSPDLDQDGKTLAESLPVIGSVWYWLWLPYAHAFPHRSPWTHLPVIGTALRQLYFLLMMWALYVVAALGLGASSVMAPWTLARRLVLSPYYHWFFAGLALSDSLHWLRDYPQAVLGCGFMLAALGVLVVSALSIVM